MYPSFLLQATQPSSNPVLGFLPILLIFGIFYFLLFLPMQRQKKQQQKMLTELKPGDSVATSGGIVGTIVSLENDTLILRVKPGDTRLQFLRSSVASRLSDESGK